MAQVGQEHREAQQQGPGCGLNRGLRFSETRFCPEARREGQSPRPGREGRAGSGSPEESDRMPAPSLSSGQDVGAQEPVSEWDVLTVAQTQL